MTKSPFGFSNNIDVPSRADSVTPDADDLPGSPGVGNGSIDSSALNFRRGTSNSADRRASHNATERSRRENLNLRFTELAAALPSLSESRKPSKSVIVQKSLEFVRATVRKMDQYSRLIVDLTQENQTLRSQLGLAKREDFPFGDKENVGAFHSPISVRRSEPVPFNIGGSSNAAMNSSHQAATSLHFGFTAGNSSNSNVYTPFGTTEHSDMHVAQSCPSFFQAPPQFNNSVSASNWSPPMKQVGFAEPTPYGSLGGAGISRSRKLSFQSQHSSVFTDYPEPEDDIIAEDAQEGFAYVMDDVELPTYPEQPLPNCEEQLFDPSFNLQDLVYLE